jgi:hypothetical protein
MQASLFLRPANGLTRRRPLVTIRARMRRLAAGLTALLLLSGTLAPGLLAACCAPAQHPCCEKALGLKTVQFVERAPCCAPREVRSGPASPVLTPERSVAIAAFGSPVGIAPVFARLHGEQHSLAAQVPSLPRALGPPLRLRI